MKRYALLLVWATFLVIPAEETAKPQSPDLTSRLKVPPGFVVEVVAAPPLVQHPMMANFDERPAVRRGVGGAQSQGG